MNPHIASLTKAYNNSGLRELATISTTHDNTKKAANNLKRLYNRKSRKSRKSRKGRSSRKGKKNTRRR
jgi:hypothetical protein